MATITRELLLTLRKDINDALIAVGKKHGVTLDAGNASFAPTYATFKLNVAVNGKDGSKGSKEAETFKQLASLWRMKANDLGKKVMLPWSDGYKYQYEIVGGRTKSDRSILCKSIGADGDGKVYVYKPSVILTALGRKADAKAMHAIGQ